MKRAIPFVIVALIFGCEKAPQKPETTETTAPLKAGDAPVEGKFSATIKVSGSQDVYQLEGAPKPERVQEMLVEAIHATEAFEPGGPRKMKAVITYEVQPLSNDSGWDVMLMGSFNSPQANFNAGVNLQGTDEVWKGRTISEMVDGAVAEFAKRIGSQARVLGGDNASLTAILEDPEEPESARLMAIQEIRERRASEHLETVRKYLTKEHSVKLRLAAAATLVSLGDDGSRAEIIKVAEDFSRDRNPQYVPLLHILGDLGGVEVVTYLEVVAEGHASPAVRTVAGEALAKARAVRK